MKLNIVFLRFSNIYGPSTSKKLSLRSSYNQIIYCALKGKIKLFENRNSKRNIIYIDDVVDSIFSTINNYNTLKDQFYYICGQRNISILNFSKLIIKSLTFFVFK